MWWWWLWWWVVVVAAVVAVAAVPCPFAMMCLPVRVVCAKGEQPEALCAARVRGTPLSAAGSGPRAVLCYATPCPAGIVTP